MIESIVAVADAAQDHVVLVDENDLMIGSLEKLAAHRTVVLHRAFSVTVINSAGEMLMQRRALTKYHSGGLWSNACCGHPRVGETVLAAAHRRLHEEMGIACELVRGGSFIYRARVGAGLVEHEYDHVLVGVHDGDPSPSPSEVMEWSWRNPSEELAAVAATPAKYTAWLPFVLPRAMECAATILDARMPETVTAGS